MAKAWMAMYWGDYRQNTSHFNCTEHGAYMMMMAHYWENGPMLASPDLYKRLYAICSCVSEVERKAVRYVLKQMFTLKAGKWRHSRMDKELTKSEEKRADAIRRGKMGGRPRKQKLLPWEGKANQSQSQSQSNIKGGDRLRRSPIEKPCPYCTRGMKASQTCCTSPICIDKYKKDFLAREAQARQGAGKE